MKTYISLLRGINVSGQKMIRMEDLRSLYDALGFHNVRSYMQSGNVVFDSTQQDVSKLSRQIEQQIKKAYGFSVPVQLRDVQDFERILATNPFLSERKEDPNRLYVTFLAGASASDGSIEMQIPNADGDEFVLRDREIFLFLPNGSGRTKFNNNFFERQLKVSATTRNWKTVTALFQMAVG